MKPTGKNHQIGCKCGRVSAAGAPLKFTLSLLENLGAWYVSLTDPEFEASEKTLETCTIFGHGGHVETAQASFGKIGKNKKTTPAVQTAAWGNLETTR